MRPQTLLPVLLGGAVGFGGILQGLRWKNAAAEAGNADLQERIAELESSIELLERENESLRSLAQGGGELKVPEPLIEFVESAIGLDFRSSPVVHKIAGEELRDRVTASIESRFPPNSLSHRQQAWVRMGLLMPDDNFAGQLAATYSIGARSWFDDQTGEGWVTDRFQEGSVPDQAALIRALVRILLHQHYPPPPGYPGDEPDRARNALHHGSAIAIENRFLARQALGIGFTGTQDDQSGARDLLESLPAFVRGLATFPSQLGPPRAGRLMDQEELLGALHSPPQTTMWFAEEGEGIETVKVAVPELPGEDVLDESAGWLGLLLWLQTLDPELSDLANAWRGDHYRLTAVSDTRLNLVWEIALATPEDAEKIAGAACVMAGVLADAESDPAVGEAVDTPDGQRVLVERPAPDRVRFSNLAAE
ncbi:hypothetical protein HAHE_13290 [Haloferula helveola]|uniref:Uncharacterized protein n=1 Tax=Haloferula helveola TaxID=490095 RepID=A0ABM7R8M3_9BACT|nr:hypothetical protein HAHE_13290 [Haloferula helveola]